MGSNWRASQSAHPPNRIVRFVSERANPGFLLSRTGPTAETNYWGMFNDGFTEQIDPPEGSPRPEPDPATRTKYQTIPTSLRAGGASSPILASMFSGQMRNVVQCEFSRGQNTKFARHWMRTHGLLEYPQPHRSGSDVALEAIERSRRQYFIIEISPAGVYAAPVEFGMTCASCARIDEYMLEGATALNLADYFAQRPEGKVQRVLSAAQIAPAYDAGSPWYATCGWAFSYSGMKAANVVARGDNSAGFDAYLTNLLRLNFSVTAEGERSVSIVRFDNVARVTFSAPHGFVEDDVVTVYGADQDEYNGAQIAQNVTTLTLDFALNSTPTSPATGNLRIAAAASRVTIGASLQFVESGRVLFKSGAGGTIWAPQAPGLWQGVRPMRVQQSTSGPVHVYYDGDEEVITRWSSAISNVAEFETATPPGSSAGNNRWNGNASGTHALGHPRVMVPVVHDPLCEIGYDEFIGSGSGERIGAHTVEAYGFSGPALGGDVTTYTNRFHGTAQSEPIGTTSSASSSSGSYALCGGGVGSGTILTEVFHTEVQMVSHEMAESAGGTSALILLWEEREAVASLFIQTMTANGSTQNAKSRYRSRIKQTLVDGLGPWTDLDIPAEAISAIWFEREVISGVETRSANGQFMVRWSGGGGYTKFIPINEIGFPVSADIVEFTRYTQGEKETAQSSLSLMRGGLWYDEPQLAPKNQRGNAVYNIDGDVQTVGGFEQLNGRTRIGFVGQV